MEEKKPTAWISSSTAAALLGVKLQTFYNDYRPLLPSAAVRRTGTKILVFAPLLMAAVARHRAGSRCSASSGDVWAAVLSLVETEGLEAARALQASLAELLDE